MAQESTPLKRLAKWLGVAVLSTVVVVLAVVGFQLVGYGRAASVVYDVAPLDIAAVTDSAVIERGRHIAESFGGCLGCHGADLGGAIVEDLGPIGLMTAPNITTGRRGLPAGYSDGQLARAIRHGIGGDGRSLLYMPAPEHNWWPDSDLTAVVSFVRSVPPVASDVEPAVVRPLGKLLRQFGVAEFLSAAMVDHSVQESVPAPEPTVRYGELLSRGCEGCHGERLSGGKMPGAPASLPIPANLTPHETGLGSWTQEQFVTALNTGVRPDGRTLDDFMPIASTRAMNDVEKTALWVYLRSIEPLEFGNR